MQSCLTTSLVSHPDPTLTLRLYHHQYSLLCASALLLPLVQPPVGLALVRLLFRPPRPHIVSIHLP